MNSYLLSLESTRSPRHGRACPGHPRLWSCSAFKTWMPATSAGMTSRESCMLVSGTINVKQCNLDSGRVKRDAAVVHDTGQDVAAGLARMMKDRGLRRIDNQVMGDAW